MRMHAAPSPRSPAPSLTLTRARAYAGYATDLLLARLPRLHAPSTRGPIRIDADGATVHCYEAFPTGTLIEDWQALFAKVASSAAFHSPDWARPLLEVLDRRGRLKVLAVYAKAELIGVLPLDARRGHAFITPGGAMSDHLDPLVSSDHRELFWQSIFRALHELADRRSFSLTLENQPNAGETIAAIRSAARKNGLAVSDQASDISAGIALPESWEAYLAQFNSHDRKELKRKLKKATADAAAELVVCSSPDVIDAALDSVFTLMEKGGGGKGRKARWIYRPHFAQAARPLAAAGRLTVYQLRLRGQTAAGLIAMPTAAGEILWCGAYDLAFRDLSPGIVTFLMIIQRGITLGWSSLDLLRGQHEYKYRLGAVDRPLTTIVIKSV